MKKKIEGKDQKYLEIYDSLMNVSLSKSLAELTVMSPTHYTDPVAKLLSYGDCSKMDFKNWPDYPSELGLTLTDVPELLRMATDFDLWEEEGIALWAPVHAWRSLGQLRSVEAIGPLIQLFEDRENEWAIEELPTIYGLIGPEAISALSEYLCDAGNETGARSTASDGLERIAIAYPDHREVCIASLTKALGEFLDNEDVFNGLLICNLMELKAVEAALLMEQAFAADMVDEMIPGTWAAVQVELGLKRKEDFTEEELQHEVPFDIQEIKNLLEILEAQSRKPEGFGATVQTKGKKVKKKKKK
jgi:hypothetical protein